MGMEWHGRAWKGMGRAKNCDLMLNCMQLLFLYYSTQTS